MRHSPRFMSTTIGFASGYWACCNVPFGIFTKLGMGTVVQVCFSSPDRPVYLRVAEPEKRAFIRSADQPTSGAHFWDNLVSTQKKDPRACELPAMPVALRSRHVPRDVGGRREGQGNQTRAELAQAPPRHRNPEGGHRGGRLVGWPADRMAAHSKARSNASVRRLSNRAPGQ